ncbi:MAG TPA: phospholipase D-like domain-containing protein [Baekduia sp.]
MAKPTPKDYFLAPHADADLGLVLAPVRAGRGLETIIDGDAILLALEEAVAAARHSVLIAFWALDAGLDLRSKAALKGGRRTWLDLLVSTARRGAMVCVLMNDFDALAFGGTAHVGAWLTYRRLVDAAADARLSNLQVVCSRHGAQVPASTVAQVPGAAGFYPAVADRLNQLDRRSRAGWFANSPSLWAVLDWLPDDTVAVKDKNRFFPVFPATHHQKLVLVDGRFAFAGGINLTEGYRDTPLHQRAGRPWHDAFLKVEGEPVGDIRDNFIGRWNEERKACTAFLTAANAATRRVSMPIGATAELDSKSIALADPDQARPSFPCQVHRTISRYRNDRRGIPDLLRRDVLDGYLLAIGLAEDFIYIENQYFREQAIADAIIDRHVKQRGLQTLIVLPDVVEELLTGPPDPVSELGILLQHNAIDRMQKAIGPNLGLYTMKRPQDDRMVYVHAKVLIVDDVYGNLGSANAHPRGFRMDTELNLAWHDPVTVRRLRTDLWKEQLGTPRGMPSWRPAEYVKRWSAIAARNDRASSKGRSGYVRPFDNREEGRLHLLIPDEFT